MRKKVVNYSYHTICKILCVGVVIKNPITLITFLILCQFFVFNEIEFTKEITSLLSLLSSMFNYKRFLRDKLPLFQVLYAISLTK